MLMDLTRRSFVRGATLSTLAFSLPRGAHAAGGVLRVSSFSDLQVLDPAHLLSSQELNLVELTTRRLVSFKGREDTSWELDAAESIEQIDDTHVKFTLRKGIVWSGGFGELTAEDVKYSFERVIDPEMQSPYAGDWAALDHVDIVDSYSGIIVLKEFSATLWTISLPGWTGLIVCKKAVEALPQKRFTTEIPASCGPYLLKEWAPQRQTTLVPNPQWSGPTPAWEEIVVVPIVDGKASELTYDAGEIDFSRLSLSTLKRYRTEGIPAGSDVLEHPSLAYVWLGMNADNIALADIRVRTAIQKAVDVQAALDAAYNGLAERSTGIIAPSLIGHRNIELPQRDVEGAKQLLAEAGVSGLQLTLDTLNDATRTTMAQVIQASLAEIGIDVGIRIHDSGMFNVLGDEKSGDSWKDIQLILNRFSMSPDPSFATEWFTPEQVGVWNWERFNSAEFGELHRKAKAEKDVAKRAEMYRRMQDLMEESGQYVFLTHELRAYVHKDSIVPELKPDGEPMFGRFAPA